MIKYNQRDLEIAMRPVRDDSRAKQGGARGRLASYYEKAVDPAAILNERQRRQKGAQ
jgi:hypothetical protein